MQILNGEFFFDQKNAGAWYTSSSTENYGPDRFRYMGAGTGKFLFRRTSSAAPVGFIYSGQIYAQTVSSGSVHNDNYHIEIPIEGIDIRELEWGTANAKDLTVQFQFASSVNGQYSITCMEGTNSLHYVTSINYTGGGAFQSFAITFPACTSGVWQSTTLGAYGLKVLVDLGSGSDYEAASPNVWGAAGSWRVAGSARFIENSGAVIYLAAFQSDVGSSALPFRFVNYDDQLRYINTANSRF